MTTSTFFFFFAIGLEHNKHNRLNQKEVELAVDANATSRHIVGQVYNEGGMEHKTCNYVSRTCVTVLFRVDDFPVNCKHYQSFCTLHKMVRIFFFTSNRFFKSYPDFFF